MSRNLTEYLGPRYAGSQENLAVEAVLRRITEALKVPDGEGGHTWLTLLSEGGPVLLDESRIKEGFISPQDNRDDGEFDAPFVLAHLGSGSDNPKQSEEGPEGYSLSVEIAVAVYMQEAADYRQATDIISILRRSFLQQRFLDGGAIRMETPFSWRGPGNPAESWPYYVVTADLKLTSPSTMEVYNEHGQSYQDNW